MAWLYGPIAAGAPVVEMARRVMRWLPFAVGALTMVVAATNGGASPGAASDAVLAGRPGRRRRPPRPRPRKDRAPRGSGPSRTGRSAGRAAGVRARRNGTSAGQDQRGGRQQVVGRSPGRRPARRGPRVDSPDRSSSARCVDDSRTDPSPLPADARRRPRRRPASRRRSPASRAGPPGAPRSPSSGATRSPRPSTSAGPPARKNGTSEPMPAATRPTARPASSVGAPRLERAVERGGRVATSRRPGRRRPGCASRAGRRAPAPGRGRRPSRRRPPPGPPRAPAGRGCRPAGPASRPVDVERVAAPAGAAPGSAGRRGRAARTPSGGRGSRRRGGR